MLNTITPLGLAVVVGVLVGNRAGTLIAQIDAGTHVGYELVVEELLLAATACGGGLFEG